MSDLDQLLQDALDSAAERVTVSDDAWIRNEELLHARQSRRRTRAAVFLSSAAAVVVAILVIGAVWLIPGQHGTAPATDNSVTPTPAATSAPPPTPHPSTTPSAAATSPAATGSAIDSSPVSTGPINEPADDALRAELIHAFVDWHKGAIPLSAIAGIPKGSLYYAYVPSSNTYWAEATIEPTAAAAKTPVFIPFQDYLNVAVFSRTGNGPWTVRSLGICEQKLPADVARLWSLPSHSDDPICK